MFGSDSEMTIYVRAKNETQKAFQQIEKSMSSFNGSLQKMQPAFKKMAAVGTATFAAIATGASKAIAEARDFEEETNKFSVVFKDVSKEAQAMADTLNKSYGLSKLQSKQLLSATGDILTGFGFAGDAALDLSGNVQTLAVDLASFTNAQGGAKAVSEALTKALLGERESLKTYGIAISEADVEAGLLEKGMGELTGEALRQAKAQVTLELAMKQSKNAIGDYGRSAGSLTQTQKELKKSFDDTMLTIGQTLTPILNEVLQKILPIIEKVQQWAEQNPELARNIIIAAAAITALVAAVGALGLILPPIIAGFTLLAGPVGIVIAVIAGLVAVGVLLYKNWDRIKETAGSVWDWIKEKISSVVDVIKAVFTAYIDFWKTSWQVLSDAVKTYIAFITGIIMMFLDWLFPGWQENIQKMIEVWQMGWDWMGEKVGQVMGWISESLGAAFGWARGLIIGFLEDAGKKWEEIWGKASDFFVKIWEPVKEAITSVVDVITEQIQRAIDMYNKLKSMAGGAISSVGSSIGNFVSSAVSRGNSTLGFEHGGTVPGPRGVAVPIMAHGQETIIPAGGSAGGGNYVVTINNPVYQSRDDERRLREQLDKYFRPLLTNHKLSL